MPSWITRARAAPLQICAHALANRPGPSDRPANRPGRFDARRGPARKVPTMNNRRERERESAALRHGRERRRSGGDGRCWAARRRAAGCGSDSAQRHRRDRIGAGESRLSSIRSPTLPGDSSPARPGRRLAVLFAGRPGRSPAEPAARGGPPHPRAHRSARGEGRASRSHGAAGTRTRGRDQGADTGKRAGVFDCHHARGAGSGRSKP